MAQCDGQSARQTTLYLSNNDSKITTGDHSRSQQMRPGPTARLDVHRTTKTSIVSDIAVFVLKRDVKLQPTNQVKPQLNACMQTIRPTAQQNSNRLHSACDRRPRY